MGVADDEMVTVVVVVPPDPVCARAAPVADNISATAGGVATANRPAFSRNSRRSLFNLSLSVIAAPYPISTRKPTSSGASLQAHLERCPDDCCSLARVAEV